MIRERFMPFMVSPFTVARTVRSLKCRQVAWRMVRPLVRRLPGRRIGQPADLRQEAREFVLSWKSPEATVVESFKRNEVCFIGLARNWAEIDWSGKTPSHLWAFHVHYGDYLVDVAIQARREADLIPALESWIIAWIRALADRASVGWEPYAAATRLSNGVRLLQCAGSLPLSPRVTDLLRHHVSEVALHVDRNTEWDVDGNHLIRDLSALCLACFCLDGWWVAECSKRSNRLLWRTVQEQFMNDGMHYERSLHYHDQALSDVLEVLAIARLRGVQIPEAVLSRLRLSVSVSRSLRDSCGNRSLFNDGSIDAGPSLVDIERLAALARVAASPASRSSAIALPSAGFWGFDDGCDRVVVDCGEVGPQSQPGHAHADALSFEAFLGQLPIVVDTGTSGYAEDSGRSFQRSERAHSTVEFAGAPQAELWSVFRVGGRPRVRPLSAASEPFSFEGEWSPFGSKRLVHVRRIERPRVRFLKIVDRVTIDGRASAVGRIQLHPRWSPVWDGDGWLLEAGEGPAALVRVSGHARAWIEQGHYAPRFGERTGRSILCYSFGIEGRVDLEIELCQ